MILQTTGISPELIPHEEFHTVIWMQSLRKPGWHYFKKCANHYEIKFPGFMRGVDAPIKELVGFLHQAGIKTTPSCSGHYFREDYINKIYSELDLDAREICDDGLKLIDVQTGDVFHFRNKNYHLPWSLKVFSEKLKCYQRKGVLGIKLAKYREEKAQLLKLRIPGTILKEIDSTVLILVECDETQNLKAWKELTAQIKGIFNNFGRSSKFTSLRENGWSIQSSK